MVSAHTDVVLFVRRTGVSPNRSSQTVTKVPSADVQSTSLYPVRRVAIEGTYLTRVEVICVQGDVGETRDLVLRLDSGDWV